MMYDLMKHKKLMFAGLVNMNFCDMYTHLRCIIILFFFLKYM